MSAQAVFLAEVSATLARQCWRWLDGDHAGVVRWLRAIGCQVTELDDTWTVRGTTGMTVGLTTADAMDPVGVGIMLGMALAGEVWPWAFPRLLEQVTAEWRRRTRAAHKARQEARHAADGR